MLPDLTNNPKWAVPSLQSSAFMAASVKERKKFMLEDLARSGLTPELVRAHVTDIMPLSKGAKGGYWLPYFGLDGRILRNGEGLDMYRIRQWGCRNRYTQPHKDQLAACGLPDNPPYILPAVHEYLAEQKVLYICEGEKKAASVMHYLDVPAIGIGGCWNWGIGKKLHPWIRWLIEQYGVDSVCVIPDGDIKRYDICTAYGTLADELHRAGVPVEIVMLPAAEDKIDDLLVAWGLEAQGAFAELGKLQAKDLVVSQSTLAEHYGLSVVGKDKHVAINDNNVKRLLEEHPAFNEFWLNTDTNDYMHGDEVVVWDIHDYRLTVYMQHFFQLHNLTRPKVADAIREIAAANARSPWAEEVNATQWDGVERLADWPIRLWGCEDNLVTREVAEKFMVGMYARMVEPGCKMDWMLVTVGAQGIGKSWWAELVSGGLNVTFMASGNARDDAAKMHKGLIVCIDELDAFNKREMTYWKTMISTNVDTFRAPYGRGEVTMKRRSVLYGTSNHRTFLRHDGTGQRRFGVLEPGCMLDVETFMAERMQLWAEAKVKYQQGVAYYSLSDVVRSLVEEEFQADDPMAEQLEHVLRQWPADKIRMRDILEALGMKNHIQNASITGKIKDILIAMGCEYKKSMRFPSGPNGPGYDIPMERIPRDV